MLDYRGYGYWRSHSISSKMNVRRKAVNGVSTSFSPIDVLHITNILTFAVQCVYVSGPSDELTCMSDLMVAMTAREAGGRSCKLTTDKRFRKAAILCMDT